jgi:RNA polymerase sigma-70 factor, ECF subfamily
MILESAAAERSMAWPQVTEQDWAALYADQLPRIYNYFRFRLGHEADVEELTSRTFEKAWRGRERYRRDLGGFSTWLFTIAHNVGLDYLRSRREHVPLEAVPNLPADSSPEREAERACDLQRLSRLTADLPERERELIALKYGAALNNRAIRCRYRASVRKARPQMCCASSCRRQPTLSREPSPTR